jgi:hypothetical protein
VESEKGLPGMVSVCHVVDGGLIEKIAAADDVAPVA